MVRNTTTHQLHTHGTELVACLDRLVQALAGDESTHEATSESITSAVGVDDLIISQSSNRVPLGLVGLVRGDGNSRQCALGKDDSTRLGVRLGKSGNSLGDLCEVLGIRETIGSSPGLSLSLIADDNIGVGDDFVHLFTEELGDERSGKVEDEGLSSGGRLAAEFEGSGSSVGEEVTFDIEELGGIDQRCDLWG